MSDTDLILKLAIVFPVVAFLLAAIEILRVIAPITG